MKHLKNLIVVIAMVIGSITPSFAQKGMQGIGADIVYGFNASTYESHFTNIGVDVFYRYNVLNIYTVQPHLSIFNVSRDLPDSLVSSLGKPSSIGIEVGVDNHLNFIYRGSFLPYANLGVSYYNIDGADYKADRWVNGPSLLLKAGLGFNYRFHDRAALNIEANPGYLVNDSYNERIIIQIKAGIVYNF